MITVPPNVRIHLACGATDMRKGFNGLSMLAQEVLKQDPFSGHLFALRGRQGRLVKALAWDGQGFWLFAKRLEQGRFVWPVTRDGSVTLTPAQLSMLLEGIDWRTPQRTWQPTPAGFGGKLLIGDSADESLIRLSSGFRIVAARPDGIDRALRIGVEAAQETGRLCITLACSGRHRSGSPNLAEGEVDATAPSCRVLSFLQRVDAMKREAGRSAPNGDIPVMQHQTLRLVRPLQSAKQEFGRQAQ